MLDLFKNENQPSDKRFLFWDEKTFLRLMTFSLTTFAIILKIAGLVVLILSFRRIVIDYRVDTAILGIVLSLFLLAMAAVVFSLLWVIRSAHRIETEKRKESYLFKPTATVAEAGERMRQDLDHLQMQFDQVIAFLKDINENTLLDETGRQQKYEFFAQQERKRTYNEIDRLVNDREWAQAKALLEGMLHRYPDNNEVLEYYRQVEDQRKQAFNDELAQTRKTVNDLIAISAWDKAIRHAEILMQKHPDMPAAKDLASNIRKERVRFRDDQVKRMSADIQRSITRKRWNDALQIARQLMEKYPDAIEAEAIRSQLTTLENNAEIEKRQELEEQIKDLVRRRNFIQAVEMARYVIEQFPSSPQASALRNQIDKLEGLAAQQEKEVSI